MLGHILVIPKRHVEKLSKLTKEERSDLFEEVINLQEKILKNIAPGCDICEHYRPFIPDNKLKVSHLHIHLRPRELNDELYKKVQINEKDVFQDIEDKEWEKYKELLND
jgi:diadenosine tetraphosphate (Ap4A) HIT family hydrolase